MKPEKDGVSVPHDLAAERATLGAVLVQPHIYGEVQWLSPEAFYREAHQALWSGIVAVMEAGKPLDMLTVRVELERAGTLDLVGGRTYIAGLIDGVPLSSNAPYYAERVRSLADKRKVIQRAESIIRQASAEDVDADTALEALVGLQDALGTTATNSEALVFSQQIDCLKEAIEKAETGPRLLLGLPEIDRQIDGIQPGEVVGIMARPGIGKTLVLCHIARSLAGLGQMVFSLEMPAPQIVERLARMTYGFNRHRLRNAVRNNELDADPYVEAFQDMLLDASPGLTVQQMLVRTRKAQRHRHILAVSIDHLGLIGGDGRSTTYDRVSQQAREIKEFAKRCDVVVILLIQANRDAGGDGSRELHLGSARDSGVIEEACDYIVALRRLDRSTTLAESQRMTYQDVLFAKLLKHRHGTPGIGEIAYRIHGESLRLQEEPELKIEEDHFEKLKSAIAGGGRR